MSRVAEFEDLYPNITVESEEYEWRATTFAATLAGGTLPDVFEIPLTDAKGLADNGQIADIDDQVQALPYAGDFNEPLLRRGTGPTVVSMRCRPSRSMASPSTTTGRSLSKQAWIPTIHRAPGTR